MKVIEKPSLVDSKIYIVADKLWKVALFGPDNFQAAVISHYVKTKNKKLKKSAIGFAKELLTGYGEEDEVSNVVAEQALQYLIKFNVDIPFPTPAKPKFKFIDLFAGIGGFRLAMQNLGGECVFSSEWDKEAQKTYYANFGEIPFGDITKEETKKWIPKEFDVLCAGFPCQAFSIAGKRGGFNDTRGTLFYDVAEIIKRHKPKAVFLENVKGLASHDKGRTLATILNVLREDLKYYVPEPEIVNAKYFGVPQNRERIFIVAFRKDMGVDKFKYPEQKKVTAAVEDILEKKIVNTKYYMSTQYFKTLVEHKARHESKGNGFGYEILNKEGVANAIVVGGMGRERNLVIDKRLKDFTPTTKIKGVVNREGVRRLTPRECARLQGFPDWYKVEGVVSDASAYKQFGNSVAVPAIQATAELVIEKIQKHLK
ncbi:MAG: DNA cytosine methyltransferase [Chitinophagaceae bacterium]|nr:DNA cytosine methyltransferase [Chitinophagaceae bacterium]